MTASALTIPEPLPDDPDAVTTALETAAIFGTQGDTREAVRWLRRAAEAAGDEGNDLRALTLARLAADMSSQITADTGNGTTAVASAAAAPIPAKSAEAVAPGATTLSELGLAPTVAAQPPAIPSPKEPPALDAGAGAPAPNGDGQPAAALPMPPAWVPPAPPPIVTAASTPESGSDPAAAAASNGDAAPAPGSAPSGSLREALQRLPLSAPPTASPAAQPDPQQSPALAALVQSIVQSTPRSQPAPSGGSPISARPGAAGPRVQTQPIASRPLASPEPKAAPEPVAELTPQGLGPQSDPMSDAITDPRFVPAVAARLDAEPSLAVTAPAQVKRPVSGVRQAVRASIAATTEEGVFLLELLKDGQAAAGHEALVVLVDPAADLFE
jgi:hypothetical protein